MTLLAFQGAVELGLIYALVALGLFVSYRVLDIPDLTVDGSFTLGAAVSAVFTAAAHPWLGLVLGAAAGFCAGAASAFLQTKLGIQPILAGILCMTGLYSINLRVMGGRAMVSLLRVDTVFTPFSQGALGKLPVAAVAAVAVGAALILFFRTQTGLCLRATGDNETMVRSSSINTDRMKFLGLGLANALVGGSGALIAQYQNSADMNTGVGMVVIGMASLIIGEALFGRSSVPRSVCAVILGAILYRIIYAFVMARGLAASDLKLISALIVMLAISYPVVVQRWKLRKLMKEAAKDA